MNPALAPEPFSQLAAGGELCHLATVGGAKNGRRWIGSRPDLHDINRNRRIETEQSAVPPTYLGTPGGGALLGREGTEGGPGSGDTAGRDGGPGAARPPGRGGPGGARRCGVGLDMGDLQGAAERLGDGEAVAPVPVPVPADAALTFVPKASRSPAARSRPPAAAWTW